MQLTKYVLKRIYGYEISHPGFAEQSIATLEVAGCSRARQYYEDWVAEYEAAHNVEMKEVAEWYKKECEKRWEKEGEQQRKQKEMKQASEKWMEGLF